MTRAFLGDWDDVKEAGIGERRRLVLFVLRLRVDVRRLVSSCFIVLMACCIVVRTLRSSCTDEAKVERVSLVLVVRASMAEAAECYPSEPVVEGSSMNSMCASVKCCFSVVYFGEVCFFHSWQAYW